MKHMVTVKDIREKEFIKQKHGYSEDEVDEFLDEIADQMEALIQENKTLMQQAQEARAMADKAISERMPAPQPQPVPQPVPVVQPVPEVKSIQTTDEAYFRNLESTLRETLLSAQRIADETVSEAKKKAVQMVSDAEEKVSTVMAQQKAELDSAKVELEGVRKASEDYRVRFKRLVREQLHAFKLDESALKEDAPRMDVNKGDDEP
jgi:cell division initiation protein